jgi:hypothetical protein
MMQILELTGKKPTVLIVHPFVDRVLGINLQIFGLDHGVTIEVNAELPGPIMLFRNPLTEEDEPWRS